MHLAAVQIGTRLDFPRVEALFFMLYFVCTYRGALMVSYAERIKGEYERRQ
jgi:hypothetical protein